MGHYDLDILGDRLSEILQRHCDLRLASGHGRPSKRDFGDLDGGPCAQASQIERVLGYVGGSEGLPATSGAYEHGSDTKKNRPHVRTVCDLHHRLRTNPTTDLEIRGS